MSKSMSKSKSKPKSGSKPVAPRPPADAPRLMLISPLLVDESAVQRLAELTGTGKIASVRLDLAEGDERALQKRAEAYAAAAQAGGAAAVASDQFDTRLVGRAGLDGVEARALEGLAEALKAMRPDRIVGAAGLTLRDDAMSAGELEPDYLLFGEPAPDGFVRPLEWRVERAQWWAQLFTLPCAVYVAAREEIAPLAESGADFLCLGPWLWSEPDALELIAQADAALAAQPVA